jgi:hypothetical protein
VERLRITAAVVVLLVTATAAMGAYVQLDPLVAEWNDSDYRTDGLLQGVRSLLMPLGKGDLLLTLSDFIWQKYTWSRPLEGG